ncbi:uncharacterized protein TM35_000152610 [Trypanosoma theileri]|uniref:Uncharacterized protein n=1 Tax=Trypanosoma theileri TaxID=67003 RepID=A0A1X0NXH1_9TRYP|nr:uncharacterized protein TM35_000152610 [Trypanosoma theileri]ORC88830.1 hypothetical protein TM35_000152610 [Trypanosoma theileri]
MSGTHHLYTRSGRPMPPPPKSTPHRSSSICRTPTRRYNPVERKSGSSWSPSGRRKTNPQYERMQLQVRKHQNDETQLVSMRGAQGRAAENAAPRQPTPPLLLENSTSARGRQRGEEKRPAAAEPRRVARSSNNRPDDTRMSTVTDERDYHSYARWNHSNEASRVSPHFTRSFSQQGAEVGDPHHSITQRLRRSLSRGYSPQRGRPTQGLVGTELMPTMPSLQGAHQTSKNRDRTTLERFIKNQPAESREEMIAMLEEYKGRENELCDALNEAYSESWEAAVRGYSAGATPLQGNNTPGSLTQYKPQQFKDGDNRTAAPFLNGEKNTDMASHVKSKEDANTSRQGVFTPKLIASAQSSPSRPQGINYSPNRLQLQVESTTPIRKENFNRNKSLERERYDDDVSPKPRQVPGGVGGGNGGATGSVPRVGGFLDYREASPRPGGMLTPPLPPDLLTR